MTSLVSAAAFAALLLATCAPAALAQESDANFHATTITLSATGEVKSAPDMATITLGVQSEARTAADAMGQNASRMTAVVAALKTAGVPGKDIQTSNISLETQYDEDANRPRRLRGYQASNTVTVTVFDIAKLGRTLDAVTAAGANQINGVRFGLKDPAAPENDARIRAVKALQAKADLYAGAVGYHVARLVNLSEGFNPPSEVWGNAVVYAGFRKADTPVEAGELTIRASVNGRYELTR